MKRIKQYLMCYWAEIVIVLLGTNLFIRLVDAMKIIRSFPFDLTNDISAYMAQLHFLKVCGFLQWCPYWYNGFINLQISPPGWYFFAYPLYFISNSVTAAMFLSIILLFAAGFLVCMFLGKKVGLSPVKRIVFFLLFFANASGVGNFIRNGRQHAMLNLILFVLLFYVIWMYKEKKIDIKYFLASILFSLMLVTHYQETVLAAMLFLCLFLYKKTIKERLLIGLSFVLSFVLAAWWLIPFLQGIKRSSLIYFHEGLRIFEFSRETIITNMMTILIPGTLIILFYLYYKNNVKAKKDILFFLPVIILAVAYMFRLTTFIPILKNISQDPYLFFFLFFILFIFFKEEKNFLKRPILGPRLVIGIILVTIGNVILSLTYTPFFVHNNPLDEEVKSLFGEVEGRSYILSTFSLEGYPRSYSKPYISFASIYHNVSSIDGWSPPLAGTEYLDRVAEVPKTLLEGDCETFRKELVFFNATDIIANRTDCLKLEGCGFREVKTLQNACLYRIS